MLRSARFDLAFASSTLSRLTFTAVLLGTLALLTSLSASAQYATVGPSGTVVLLNAPPVAFPAVGPAQTRAGISLADRTGITNNPETVQVATVGSAGALYNGSAVANGAAVYNGAALGTSEVPDGQNVAQPNATAARVRRDWGTSVFVGDGPVGGSVSPAAGAPSLGEIATKLKTTRGQSKRTYTNADAQRISDNLKIRGTNRTVNPPNNTPPPR